MNRIESLTFFRFVAAIIVVIFHFGSFTDLAQLGSPLIISGEQVVSFFFVLSGFILMISRFDKENEKPRDFYWSRLARILPLYLIAMAGAMFLWDYIPFGGTNRLLEVFLNLTFLQAWFPPYPLTLNFPAWAVSVELFFYLLFPFILWAIRKSNISWKYLAMMALGTYIFTQVLLSNLLIAGFYEGNPSVSHDLIYFFPPVHFCSFFLGISGGYLYLENKNQFNRSGWFPFLIMLAVLATNFLTLQHPGFLQRIAGFPIAFGASFYSLPFILLIMGMAYADNFLTRFLSNRFFRLLGNASYSIYILQLPFWILYNVILYKYFQVNLLVDLENFDNYFYFYVFLLILVSIVALIFIERPAKRWILNTYYHFASKKEVSKLES